MSLGMRLEGSCFWVRRFLFGHVHALKVAYITESCRF
jgi:hypothetical protein